MCMMSTLPTCMAGTQGGQMKASDSLELESASTGK